MKTLSLLKSMTLFTALALFTMTGFSQDQYNGLTQSSEHKGLQDRGQAPVQTDVIESSNKNMTVKSESKSVETAKATVEVKDLKKQVRKIAAKQVINKINPFKKNTASSPSAPSIDGILLLIVTILVPWLGVLLFEGELTKNFWLTLLLTFLFYIPGLIYALMVIY